MNTRTRTLTLTLTAGGGAELTDTRGKAVWNSVNDESFRDEFPDEMLDADDIESILEYLVDDDVISASEADNVECAEESLDGDDVEDEEDEDDEDAVIADDDGDEY